MYPYPMISRAYVPGPDADPATPGKYNFWEAAGLSYYTPRMGPLQLEAGARLAFLNPPARGLTPPPRRRVSHRPPARRQQDIKESPEKLGPNLLFSLPGGRGNVNLV